MNGRTLGYFVGRGLAVVVVIPLAYYLITIFFDTHNKVTEEIIHQYMTDTIIIKDSIGWGVYSPTIDDSIGIQWKTYTAYSAQNRTGDRRYFTYIFYTHKYNKYVELTSMAGDNGAGSVNGFPKDIEFIMTVNKKDFNNPAYGTKANPVPVFKFVGADTSIRPNNQDYNQAYIDTMFLKNVEIYLKYIMPKKEFKARYGK